jgi:AcrR family transcriptional regulator
MNEELLNILKKVRVLYRKYGIRSVTMDDVSHELGISKKTLYQYVKDKDELVHKVVALEIQDHHTKMVVNCTDNLNAIEQLIEIARCVALMLKDYSPATDYDLKKYYPDLYIRLREIRHDFMHKFISENLMKGKKEGIFRDDFNVVMITKLNVSIIDNMFDNENIPISEFLDPQFFYEYFMYHIRGVANAKGLSILESQQGKLEFIK